MRGSRVKSYRAVFAITPIHKGPVANEHLAVQDNRRAVVQLLSILPGEKVVVAAGSSMVLVQTLSTPSPAVTIRTREGLESKILKNAGEACSLDSACTLISDVTLQSSLVAYEIPKASFRAFALHSSSGRTDAFAISEPVPDSFLHLLSRAVLPIVASGQAWTGEFARYFAMGLYFHLLERYGVRREEWEYSVGGLSPRNKSLVGKALQASHGTRLSIETLAGLCHLSSRQFARAFQQTFGAPFYKVQLEIRIDRAKKLLIETDLSLAKIAVEMGYADQATFTESFARIIGLPPGRFRRQHRMSEMVAASF